MIKGILLRWCSSRCASHEVQERLIHTFLLRNQQIIYLNTQYSRLTISYYSILYILYYILSQRHQKENSSCKLEKVSLTRIQNDDAPSPEANAEYLRNPEVGADTAHPHHSAGCAREPLMQHAAVRGGAPDVDYLR